MPKKLSDREETTNILYSALYAWLAVRGNHEPAAEALEIIANLEHTKETINA